MRLLRIGEPGMERPAVLDGDGVARDLTGLVDDYGPAFFASGRVGLVARAGYAISNDVSERAFQLELSPQWDIGKSCETFNPLGPWLVTPDDVPDPERLGMRLSVNGERRQDSRTDQMIFGVTYLIWYLSQHMVLEPGDLINTGTPAGVALGRPDQPSGGQRSDW